MMKIAVSLPDMIAQLPDEQRIALAIAIANGITDPTQIFGLRRLSNVAEAVRADLEREAETRRATA